MLSPEVRQRARFLVGDPVSFSYRGKRTEGTLSRLNPKRAVVLVGKNEFSVPYDRLLPLAGKCSERIQRLKTIQNLAVSYLQQHRLKGWQFQFDHATRRAGCCNYRNKRITLALELAANGSMADIRDTILHEIAHALVGRKHSHDAVWKARALEIGCSGERTHTLSFSTPRWSVTCENRCWTHTAQQRNPKLICRTCGAKLVYTPYTAQLNEAS